MDKKGENAVRKLFLLLAMLCLFIPSIASATDIPLPTIGGPIYKLNSLVWGNSGPQGFNNNFYFVPLAQNEYVCVYVYNQNPSNSHTFSASIAVTGDPTSTTPSANTWQSAASSNTLTAGIGLAVTISASISGVSQASINLSASVTQAGSPDTANIVISQTVAPCFSGNSTVSSNSATVNAVPPIQAISDGLSQAYAYSSGNITNPLSGQMIHLVINSGLGQLTAYLDRVVIVASAAATVNILVTTNIGTTCITGPSVINIKASSTTSPQNTATRIGACGVNPAGATLLFAVPVQATIPTTIDLRGIILPPGSNGGVDVVMAAALTGTISDTFFFYEK